MKARELMIGDWVELYGTPTRWELEDYAKWHKEMERTDVHTFEPIPLTPEILEKNGLESSEYYGSNTYKLGNSDKYITFDKTGYVDLCIEYEVPDYGEEDLLKITTIQYVHELQHALKLCGIDKQIIL